MDLVGLIEVRVSWPEHPRLKKKKKMSKKGNERIYEILSPSLTCYILLENTTKNWKIYILNILNELVDFLRHLIKLY